MIEVKNIYKSFQGVGILSDINMLLKTKQLNMVIGKSGGGKTVLMKILLSLLTPDAGEIIYDDISFFASSDVEKKSVLSKIGMVFQGSALFDSLDVKQNVMMPLDFYTKEKYKVKYKKVLDALDRVNLAHAANKKTNELSGGMKKRVAIARAMILNPTYFFLDEPNSGLDPQTSMLIDKLVQDLTFEKNMTTIINTHDMNSVLTMGDNVHFVYKGKIWWNGNYKEIPTTQNAELKQFVFANQFFNLNE